MDANFPCSVILSPPRVEGLIWERHQAELGPGILHIFVDPWSTGPIWSGYHIPASTPPLTDLKVGKKIQGDILGLAYEVFVWEVK